MNALAPGYIATDLTEGIRNSEEREKAILGRVPAGRWGSPGDLEGAVVYLASRARYVALLTTCRSWNTAGFLVGFLRYGC